MLRSFRLAVALAASLMATALAGDTLCSIAPSNYKSAKSSFPASKFALDALENYGVSTWYSDRTANGNYAQTASDLVAACADSTRLNVVVYGIPNKDCAAGESQTGSTVTTTAQYVTFLQTLIDAVGSRKVLYILEPDAIGLLADSTSCGQSAGYLANLKTAIGMLSNNDNAQIYLDVGYWTLEYTSTANTVASIVKELVASGSKVKGISLNTSNYQSSSLLATLCNNFQTAVGSSDLHCIFDTSRNYNGAPSSDEWCNVKSAGVGARPTSDTGISNVDYFLWVKPPGDSDGTCAGRTSDAMTGPGAGIFSNDIFTAHWNQGIFVKELGYHAIDGTIYESTDDNSTASSASTASASADDEQLATTAPTKTGIIYSTTSSVDEERSYDDSSASVEGEADSATFTVSTIAPSTAEQTPTPTTTTASPSTADQVSASSDAQEANTQSEGGSAVSTGVIVLIGLVGAAVAALAAIIGVRARQKKLLEEAKTPTDPYPTPMLGGGMQLSTARDSNMLSAL